MKKKTIHTHTHICMPTHTHSYTNIILYLLYYNIIYYIIYKIKLIFEDYLKSLIKTKR